MGTTSASCTARKRRFCRSWPGGCTGKTLSWRFVFSAWDTRSICRSIWPGRMRCSQTSSFRRIWRCSRIGPFFPRWNRSCTRRQIGSPCGKV
ncbi:hypothetical protein NOIMNB_NOIMNB_07400, partial [Dysosmobacter welbionis]